MADRGTLSCTERGKARQGFLCLSVITPSDGRNGRHVVFCFKFLCLCLESAVGMQNPSAALHRECHCDDFNCRPCSSQGAKTEKGQSATGSLPFSGVSCFGPDAFCSMCCAGGCRQQETKKEAGQWQTWQCCSRYHLGLDRFVPFFLPSFICSD